MPTIYDGTVLDQGGAVHNVKSSAVGAVGDGTTNDRAVLNTLMNTTLQPAGGTVVFPTGTYKIGTNLTAPANVSLVFCYGAVLKPSSSVTVTIKGTIAAGLWQIFDASAGGSVTFGLGLTGTTPQSPLIRNVFPHWWGVVADGVADDSAAFIAAEAAARDIGATVRAPAGVYALANVPFREGTLMTGRKLAASLVGDGVDRTIFVPTSDIQATDYLLDVYMPTLGNVSSLSPARAAGGWFDGFTVLGSSDHSVPCNGMRADGGNLHFGVIAFRNINGVALHLGKDNTCREGQLGRLVFRSCGSYENSLPALLVDVPSSEDDQCNNLYFDDIIMVYPWYAGIHVRATTDLPTRSIVFRNLMLHGYPQASDVNAAQGRISASMGMLVLEGAVQNIVVDSFAAVAVSTDDDNTGLGSPCTLIRLCNSVTYTGSPSGITLAHCSAANDDPGYFLKIDASAGDVNLIGLSLLDTSTFASGHVEISSGSFDRLHVAACKFEPSLSSVYYDDATKVRGTRFTVSHPFAADAAANSTTAELVLFTAPQNCFVHALRYAPNSAVTGNSSNYAQVTVKRRSSNDTIVILDSRTTISAWTGVSATGASLVTPSALMLSAGDSLTVQIQKAGTGVQLPAATFTALISFDIRAQSV